MKYTESHPCAILQPFIHSFWELNGDENDSQWQRNFPDGCGGLVFNLGDTCTTDNGGVALDFGKTYVVGVMTSFKDTYIEENNHLFGVCLTPAAFSNFYNFVPQNELVNKTVQLDKADSFNLAKFMKAPLHYMNGFFTDRLKNRKGLLQVVIDDIHKAGGKLTIDEIASRHCLSERQLERKLKTLLGLTPKEYSSIVRFQKALTFIKMPENKQSLLDIAFECGYYDHSHLSNEIKRKTGLWPSQL